MKVLDEHEGSHLSPWRDIIPRDNLTRCEIFGAHLSGPKKCSSAILTKCEISTLKSTPGPRPSNILRAGVGANVEVAVVLKRDADQASDGILRGFL